MEKTITFSPPNSVILLMDFNHGDIPNWNPQKIVSATKTCIAVGTLNEIDGETLVRLFSDTGGEIDGLTIYFDGFIETPNKEVALVTILNEKKLEMEVKGTKTRIRVYANDEHEPDKLSIVFD